MKVKKLLLCVQFAVLLATAYTNAENTIGLIQHNAGSTDDGYVLFAPSGNTSTYLINKCGYQIHKWEGKYRPGLSVYLLPNGQLLRTGMDESSAFFTGGGGGIIEIQNWDGTIAWGYKISDSTQCQHHDVKYMPNGNILAIVWDKIPFEDLQLAGRNPELQFKDFWCEKIVELKPIGKDSAEIVWIWRVRDHFMQNYDSTRENYVKHIDNPRLMDINCPKGKGKDVIADWLHFNSIDYNEKLDQIVISSPYYNEIWIIDHSTTTAEAASHKGGKYGMGGDILYRWGNPIVYGHGTVADQKLFYQHNVHWIPEGFPYAGDLMIFNNMCGPNNAKYSSVDIISPPITEAGDYEQKLPYGPPEPLWAYKSEGFYSKNISGAQELLNGNVLICDGPAGKFFEIDKDGYKVWEYVNPVVAAGVLTQGSAAVGNDVFRCTFYPMDYSAFEGKDLSPKKIIENKNVNSYGCSLFEGIDENADSGILEVYPNPTSETITLETNFLNYTLEVFDNLGGKVISEKNVTKISTKSLLNGMYFINLMSDSGEYTSKAIIIAR